MGVSGLLFVITALLVVGVGVAFGAGGAPAGAAVGGLLHFCVTRTLRWLHANVEVGTPR